MARKICSLGGCGKHGKGEGEIEIETETQSETENQRACVMKEGSRNKI